MSNFGTFSGSGLGFGVAFTLQDRFTNVANKINNKFRSFSFNTDKLADKINNSFGKIAAGTGLLFSGVASMNGLLKSIDLASDYVENMNKLEVTFGAYSNQVKNFTDSALKNFGIDKVQASEMAALFGDMAVGMKIAQDEAANMATALVGLAGDIASFKNMSHKQVQTALAGVFTGETESLKRLGILMTQKNVEEFANSLSAENVKFKKLGQAEQVMIRYKYVVDASKNSVGDFLRTAEGFANVKRYMEGTFKEMTLEFGSRLEPVLTTIYFYVQKLTQTFIDFSKTGLGKTIISVVGFIASFMALSVILVGIIILVKQLSILVSGFAFPIVLLGLAVGFLVSAWTSFTEVLEGNTKVGKGFLGFLQKVGAMLYSIIHIFQTANDEGFSISGKLYKTLEEMDLTDIVISIGTYIVRMKAFFKSVSFTILKIWSTTKEVILDIYNSIEGVLKTFGFTLNKNKTALDNWKKAGVIAGEVLIGVMGLLTIALTVQLAIWIKIGVIAFFTYGWIILAVGILVALFASMLFKFEEWGAAIALLMGPIGWFIIGFMTVKKHWYAIVDAFTDGGLMEGLKAIGVMILDQLISPLQQLLSLLADIPIIGDLAQVGVDELENMKIGLGVDKVEYNNLKRKQKEEEEDRIKSENSDSMFDIFNLDKLIPNYKVNQTPDLPPATVGVKPPSQIKPPPIHQIITVEVDGEVLGKTVTEYQNNRDNMQ